MDNDELSVPADDTPEVSTARMWAVYIARPIVPCRWPETWLVGVPGTARQLWAGPVPVNGFTTEKC